MRNIINILHVCFFVFCLSSVSPEGCHAVEQHLGQKSAGFGSSAQSKALLSLMSDHPKETEAKITYTTDIDVVVFGFSRDNDNLIRVHQKRDGSGTTEVWSGDIVFRLNKAAEGGSLNDTSQGKKPGTFSTF
jgi:hypothetical protein